MCVVDIAERQKLDEERTTGETLTPILYRIIYQHSRRSKVICHLHPTTQAHLTLQQHRVESFCASSIPLLGRRKSRALHQHAQLQGCLLANGQEMTLCGIGAAAKDADYPRKSRVMKHSSRWAPKGRMVRMRGAPSPCDFAGESFCPVEESHFGIAVNMADGCVRVLL